MTACERLGIAGMKPEHVALMIPEWWNEAIGLLQRARLKHLDTWDPTTTEELFLLSHVAQRLFNRAMGEE